MNLRLKGGHCERQKLTFHFIFPVFACCFKQTLPKTNRSFHSIAVVQGVLLRDTVRCSAPREPRNNLKGHYAYHKYDGGSTLRFTF